MSWITTANGAESCARCFDAANVYRLSLYGGATVCLCGGCLREAAPLRLEGFRPEPVPQEPEGETP